MPLLQKGRPTSGTAPTSHSHGGGRWEREARAKVIAAEGEMRASHSLREAGDVISTSPAALQVHDAPARILFASSPPLSPPPASVIRRDTTLIIKYRQLSNHTAPAV